MVKRYAQVIPLLVGIGDVMTAGAAWAAAYCLRYLGGRMGLTPFEPPSFRVFVFPMCFSMVLALVIFGRLGLYSSRRTQSLPSDAWNSFRAVLVVWAVTYVVGNFTQSTAVSRLLMAGLLVSWPPLAVASRLVTGGTLRWLRRHGWNLRAAAIVGTGRLAQTLYHAVKRNSWMGIEPRYFVEDGGARQELLGLDVLAPVESIDAILRSRPVDIVFVALSSKRSEEIEQVINRLAVSPVDIRVVPDLLSFHFLRHDISQLEDLPIITLTGSPQHGLSSALKRLFDIAVASAAILLTAVPMILIAAAVKLTSRGPVFYRQQRASLGGRPFQMFKFRTMVQDAEARSGPVWTSPDDPRVTPFGRLLRRVSLDELPQLFNVLLGHMSLVGPRPERPELIENFRKQVPRYMLRHHVKAGLTGWAQIHGLRGQTSLRKRVQYDLYYITHWSFGLDLRIVALTPFRGLLNANAY